MTIYHKIQTGNGASRALMRGRRYIGEIINTRPEIVGNTKQGSSGTTITLGTNYFRLVRKPEWSIHQYRVDFSPEIEAVVIRKALLRAHMKVFNGFLFDGTMLFSSTKLDSEITQFCSARNDGSAVAITVKYVKEVLMTEIASLHILNIILRRAMEGLNLQLVGRNFFDAIAKVSYSLYHHVVGGTFNNFFKYFTDSNHRLPTGIMARLYHLNPPTRERHLVMC